MPTESLRNVPSAVALLGLTIILFVLRRRQPQILIGPWTIAISATCIRQSLWFYGGISRYVGAPHIIILLASLLCDIVTGGAFLSFYGKHLPDTRRRIAFIILNTVPVVALATLYSLAIYQPSLYIACSTVGIVLVVITIRKSFITSAFPWLQIATWVCVATFAHFGNARAATYWAVGGLFFNAAINSWDRLSESSLGRFTFTLSLTLWGLSFYVHAWKFSSTTYGPILSQIWETQKFFAIIAMLIVLLEAETRENQRLALYDQLTGLANRRLMEQRFLHAIAHGKALVILFDINNFKSINDTLGHPAGDELLRQFAGHIQSLLGNADTFARLGGDEFLIVQPLPDPSLLSKIQESLPLALSFDQTTQPIDAGVGAAAFPEDAEGQTGREAMKKLLSKADLRMYASKSAAIVSEAGPRLTGTH